MKKNLKVNVYYNYNGTCCFQSNDFYGTLKTAKYFGHKEYDGEEVCSVEVWEGEKLLWEGFEKKLLH